MSTKNVQTINIHGKAYIPVAERVRLAHEDLKENFSIDTEIVSTDPVIVVKAKVTTPKGSFTAFSAANPSKTIEAQSPYEVAETSAIGRALGFAGYGVVDSIATADEMSKPAYSTYSQRPNVTPSKTQPAVVKTQEDRLVRVEQNVAQEALDAFSEVSSKQDVPTVEASSKYADWSRAKVLLEVMALKHKGKISGDTQEITKMSKEDLVETLIAAS